MKSEPAKIPFQKVTFTIPASLLEKIDRAAAADNRSRSQWMAMQLERHLPDQLQVMEAPPGKTQSQKA